MKLHMTRQNGNVETYDVVQAEVFTNVKHALIVSYSADQVRQLFFVGPEDHFKAAVVEDGGVETRV